MATGTELSGLVATATNLVVGTSLIEGLMPDTPDVCAAIYETPGAAPDFVMGQSGIAVEYPRAQLVFRGAAWDYAGPRALAEAAYRALAGVANQVVAGTRWLTATPLQPPFQLKRDARNRVYIAFNVQIEKAVSV